MKPKGSKVVGGGEMSKTIAVIRDLSLNPKCSHGPTILFEREGSRFFSCAAYRSRKLCPFFLRQEEWQLRPSQEGDGRRGGDCGPEEKRLKLSVPLEEPLQHDRGEAQYHFTPETVQFFINLLESLGISSLVCVGTPSLHQAITDNLNLQISSFLLDIDHRLVQHTGNSAHYNMCNHHFFSAQGRQHYLEFLRGASSLAIITDPPFGAKVELIWNGALASVKQDFVSLKQSQSPLKCEILWVFPYFMEGHILNKCDIQLRMSDYKVQYKNHAKFHEKTGSNGNGKSSPVRIFTTISLSLVKLPENLYKYCDICEKWVDRRNSHCNLCKTCTTKDGGDTYRHCDTCDKCVKPTWTHCTLCCKCHLKNACHNTSFKSREVNPTLNKTKKTTTFKKSNSKKKKQKRRQQ